MMDSFELTKIAGGVLLALLLIVAPKTFIDLARHGHNAPVTTGGYTIPVSTEAAGGGAAEGGATAPAGFDPAAVIALLPTANPENGQGTFKKCLACHSAEKGAASKAGPNLWGVLGRKHGSQPDFGGYSEAMKSSDAVWNYADLASFVHKPKAFIPGTKMLFAGVAEPQDVADLVAYVRTLSDSPEPLPAAAAPAPAPEAAPAPAAPEAAPAEKAPTP
jgi:cytochrome c